MNEEERRRRALEELRKGGALGEVAAAIGRTRQWLAKWRERFALDRERGLRSRSRAPRRSPTAMPTQIVRAVLRARDRLVRHGRGREFSGRSADAVAWELHLARVRPMPSRRTIERIVERHGRTQETRAPRRVAAANGYPAPRALAWGDLQETDLVGPRHLRTARGPLLFFSFHTVDVAGGGAATGQFPDKSAESFCAYLVEIAWPCLGLPRVWQVDNEAALAGYSGRGRIFTQPVRLALLLGVEVRFIPAGEPGRNADVESFNDLWQERVLRRFACRTAHHLARVSARFERWFMEERPHPKLGLARHGTRFPAVLRSSLDGEIRTLPGAFRRDDFRDREGQLRLPLARGRVSWVRRVGEDGVVVAGRRLRLGRAAANRYVLAALSTARGELAVRLDGRLVSRWRFPINEHVVQPLRPRGG